MSRSDAAALRSALDELSTFAEQHSGQPVEMAVFNEAERIDARVGHLCRQLEIPTASQRAPNHRFHHFLLFTQMPWQEQGKGGFDVWGDQPGEAISPYHDDSPARAIPEPDEQWRSTMRSLRAQADVLAPAQADALPIGQATLPLKGKDTEAIGREGPAAEQPPPTTHPGREQQPVVATAPAAAPEQAEGIGHADQEPSAGADAMKAVEGEQAEALPAGRAAKVLLAMFELGATSREGAKSQDTIAGKAIAGATRNSLSRVWRALKAEGWIETGGAGSESGTWLTAVGVAVVQRLLKLRQ